MARDLGLTVEELRHKLTPESWASWVAFYAWEAEQKKKPPKGGKGR